MSVVPTPKLILSILNASPTTTITTTLATVILTVIVTNKDNVLTKNDNSVVINELEEDDDFDTGMIHNTS